MQGQVIKIGYMQVIKINEFNNLFIESILITCICGYAFHTESEKAVRELAPIRGAVAPRIGPTGLKNEVCIWGPAVCS